MVDTNHIDWDSILGRGRNDHLLRSTSEVQLCLLLLSKHSCGLAHVIRASGSPPNAARVLLVKDLDLGAIDHEIFLPTLLFCRDLAIKSLVHTVILELVDHVLQIHEGVVHCFHLFLRVGHGRSENQAADAAKAIDSHGGRHWDCRWQKKQVGWKWQEPKARNK